MKNMTLEIISAFSIKIMAAAFVSVFVLLPPPVRAAEEETDSAKVEVVEDASLVDVQNLMKELREKEKELNAREADLNARETRIGAIEQDVIRRENDLKKMRKEVTDRIEELKGAEDQELDKLAKIYSSAKPKSAAAIIVKMDLEKSVAVFRKMTPSAAGKILNEMGRLDPVYASRLSEALTPQPVFDKP